MLEKGWLGRGCLSGGVLVKGGKGGGGRCCGDATEICMSWWGVGLLWRGRGWRSVWFK